MVAVDDDWSTGEEALIDRAVGSFLLRKKDGYLGISDDLCHLQMRDAFEHRAVVVNVVAAHQLLDVAATPGERISDQSRSEPSAAFPHLRHRFEEDVMPLERIPGGYHHDIELPFGLGAGHEEIWIDPFAVTYANSSQVAIEVPNVLEVLRPCALHDYLGIGAEV